MHCITLTAVIIFFLLSFIHVQLSNPWTVAHQTPLSMGFSRQEYWNGLPCSPPWKKCTHNERTSISIEPTKSWYIFSNPIIIHLKVIDEIYVMYFYLLWCSIANYFKSYFLIVTLKHEENFLLHWKAMHGP